MTTTPSEIPFDSNATAYSLNNAYWLAQAAIIAYQEKNIIQPAAANFGLENFEFLSKNDTEGYIAANENIIVVAFRGTQPSHIQDLLTDAEIEKLPGPLGEVHGGFLHAYELVKNDVFDTIELVGEAAGIPATAKSKVAELKSRVAAVATRTATKIDSRPRVALLEWIDPPFNAGHWNPQLVDFAGGIDCLGNEGMPSRTLDWLEIETAAPEVLFIACCGYSLQRTLADLPILTRQPGWTKLPSTQSDRVYAFDGSAYFSRPGPRLVDSIELLAHLLHPHVHALPNCGKRGLVHRLRQVSIETNWNKLTQL